MAEKPQAQNAPKKITCRVVSNYGGHLAGAIIAVDEKEYVRMRAAVLDDNDQPTGEYRFPVLITDADAAVLAKREEAERSAKARAAQQSADYGAGWAEMERQSLARVRADYAVNQKRAADELKNITEAPQE
jgi:hypothetical protein